MFVIGMLQHLRRLEHESCGSPEYRDGIAELRRRILDGKTTGDPTLDEVIVFRSEHVFAFADAVRNIEAALTVEAPCPVVVMYGAGEHIAQCIASGTRLSFSRLSKEVCLPSMEHHTFDIVAGRVRTIETALPLGGVALKEPEVFARRIFVGEEACADAARILEATLARGIGEVVDIMHIASQAVERRSQDTSFLAARARTITDRRVRLSEEIALALGL